VGAGKTLSRLLGGKSDAAFRFDELCSLLERIGFEKRVKVAIMCFAKRALRK